MQPGSEDQIAAAKVKAALRSYQPHARRLSGDDSWLVAKWDPKLHRVVFGCKHCIAAVQAGAVPTPFRYRDPEKSNAFFHYNVYQDIKRGIGFHLESKIHAKVMGISRLPADSRFAAQERQVWVNTAWLACKNLLKLNSVSNFKESVAEARDVGGNVMSAERANTAYYYSCLEYLDMIEVPTIRKEISISPFPVYLCEFNTDDNLAILSVAFFNADFEIARRLLRVEKFPRGKQGPDKAEWCQDLLAYGIADAGTTLQHMAAFVQTPDIDDMLAKIRSQSPRCLQFRCDRRNDDMALRMQWEAAKTQDKLERFDTLFRSVIKCLNDNAFLADELGSCVSLLPSCIFHIAKYSWRFPKTRKWIAPKPFICSLAEDYLDYIEFCDIQQKKARRQIQKECWNLCQQFLRKADTYISALLLADCVEICRDDSTEDVAETISRMKAVLTGYILEKPSIDVLETVGLTTSLHSSLVEDALQMGPLPGSKFYIHKGLRRIGFKPGKEFREAQLHDSFPTACASGAFLRMDKVSIMSALEWGKQFAQGTIASLQLLYPEASVWLVLRDLISWQSIGQTHMPAKSLSILADYFCVAAQELQEQWQILQPVVAAKVRQVEAESPTFQQELARILADVPLPERGLMHSTFVTFLLASQSADQLAKDLKSLKERYKEGKHRAHKIGTQLKVFFNHKERGGDDFALASTSWDLWSSSHHWSSLKAEPPKCRDVGSGGPKSKRRRLKKSGIGLPDANREPLDETVSDGDDGIIGEEWLKRAKLAEALPVVQQD